MIPPWITDAATLRATIARWVLGASDPCFASAAHALDPSSGDMRVGSVTLRPHQRDAVVRLHPLLARDGGALLADEVGLGKTWVALALARRYPALTVVAPAALRSMWHAALARAGRGDACIVTFEALSRAAPPAPARGLVVVDESHHARNRATRRWRALARLCQASDVLLLSATPLHNRRPELATQLALFLGARAFALDDAALARHVVRRTEGLLGRASTLPRWERGAPVLLPVDGTMLDRLLAIPPPAAPADGGTAGALVLLGLVRQWASSDAALRSALRRRLATTEALLLALESGRRPTRLELAAWTYADGALQLGFPELLVAHDAATSEGATHSGDDLAQLRAEAEAHARAVRGCLATLHHPSPLDAARTDALRAIRERHGGAKVVAFSAYAETVAALFRGLRALPGVGRLTASGGEVAGGSLTRSDLLARFAPDAQGAPAPRTVERVDLLLATDVLSEGVNLQDASVVVHLDLPWTPARLAQRVGRVRRMGSMHATIAEYRFPPPVAAERWMGIERRLAEKARQAAAVVGGFEGGMAVEGGVAPDPARAASASPAERESRRRERVRPWLAEGDGGVLEPPSSHAAHVMVAAVRAARTGILVAVRTSRGTTLGGTWGLAVGRLDRDLTEADDVVDGLLDVADGPVISPPPELVGNASEAVARWLRTRDAAALLGTSPRAAHDPSLRRLERVRRETPRHRLVTRLPRLQAARAALATAHGAGAEAELARLAVVETDDEAWLSAVARLEVRRGGGPNDGTTRVALLFLLT